MTRPPEKPPAEGPPPPSTAAATKRALPERSIHFDHLALDELRAYRNDLTDEETRVSYWRRVLQARIDIVRGGTALTQQGALHRLLSTETVQAGRTSLIRLVPSVGLPPLPDLGELWTLHPVGGDSAADAELLLRLQAAEVQLSAYRKSLHVRIDEATAELIARYRERPALAIRALPLTPPMRGRPSGY